MPRFRLFPSDVLPSGGKDGKKDVREGKNCFLLPPCVQFLLNLMVTALNRKCTGWLPEVYLLKPVGLETGSVSGFARFVVECKCMMNACFLCVCSGVDRLQGLALASTLHSAYPLAR